MQIVIPMSGFGERFRRAGYTVPKPLIEVDGKPIVAHVIDLFDPVDHLGGANEFLFICNQAHLDDPSYDMAGVLQRYCPAGRIAGIAPHKLGPVAAVLAARRHIATGTPVVVNYCDFTCFWDFRDFSRFVTETGCAGAVPAYRGFHPHSLGGTHYAYMRERHGWLEDIQEKQPFTDAPMEEYASSGTYYFSSGALCLDACQAVVDEDQRTAGEYYVSTAMKILVERGAPVAVYGLQHFMQWGTPDDLAEYVAWSSVFRRLIVDDGPRARQRGTVMVPMAGDGRRFVDAGYELPKPLIPVSGRPMAVQASLDLPCAESTRFVIRHDLPQRQTLTAELDRALTGVSMHVLTGPTEGQAITCREGLAGLDLEAPLTIGACDNGMLYDHAAIEKCLGAGGPDLAVWVVRGHADGRRRPHLFGWVTADDEGRVSGVRVKIAPDDPATAPMIVGAFTFRRAADFERACARLVERNGRVNGEFYIDSLVEDAVALGLDCRLFEIDHYLGWGTPDDLRTFEYWQSCLHKWRAHPYRLELDRRVPALQVGALAARYAAVPVPRPGPRS